MELTRESTAFDYGRYNERMDYDRARAAAKPAHPERKRGAAARYALLLIVAAAVAAVCIAWLSMKSEVYKSQREVNDVQAQIQQAQRLSTDLDQQLNDAMNVNTVIARAEALGMTYPGDSQVLYANTGDNSSGAVMKNGK